MAIEYGVSQNLTYKHAEINCLCGHGGHYRKPLRCPDGIAGCAVFHFRVTCPECDASESGSSLSLAGLDETGKRLARAYVERLRLGMDRHGPWKEGDKLDPKEVHEEILDALIYAQRQLDSLE